VRVERSAVGGSKVHDPIFALAILNQRRRFDRVAVGVAVPVAAVAVGVAVVAV